MRIEEVSPGEFIKVPNILEQKMIKTMNRFFETGNDAVKGSREDIILEVEKRIRPLISNMVKRIAWLEGKEIFEQQLKVVLDEQVEIIADKITEIVKDMRIEVMKFIPMKIKINHVGNDIPFSTNIIFDKDKDIIQVFLNGMKQEIDDSFIYILDSTGNVTGISFNTTVALKIGDVVKLDCFVYSEQVTIPTTP